MMPVNKWSQVTVALALLGTLVGSVQAASTGPTEAPASEQDILWDGISVVSTVSGLDVRRAKTRIRRTGQRFHASMLNDAGEPIQTITGTVRSGKVNARRIVLNSDVGEEPLQGTWVSTRIGPYRAQSIVLSNEWAVVSLTHSLLVDRSASVPPRAAPSGP